MNIRFLPAIILAVMCPVLLADEAATTPLSAPEPQAAQASGIQIRNNSAFAIYVIQSTQKVEVAPKSTLVVKALTPPISITPVIIKQANVTQTDSTKKNDTPSFKYVTLTGQAGPCEFASCLIVQ